MQKMFDWDEVVSIESSWYRAGKASAEKLDSASYSEGFDVGYAKATEVAIELIALKTIMLMKLAEFEKKDFVNLKAKKRIEEIVHRIESFPSENLKDFDFENELQRVRSSAKAVNVSFDRLQSKDVKTETIDW